MGYAWHVAGYTMTVPPGDMTSLADASSANKVPFNGHELIT